MRKRLSNVIFLFVLFNLLLSKDGLAWNDGVTHKDLSEYAANSSVMRTCKDEADQNCDFLKNIGFNIGLDEVLTWQKRDWSVTKWLREGAQLEDAGTKWEAFTGNARFNNHFHNPIKTWTSAGLDDTVFGLHYAGESSIIWAQDGGHQQNFREGNWSWQKIREYYYNALTSTHNLPPPFPPGRDAYFAQTFRGLGHQMHLIEDAAQPDHVRNDAHPEDAMFGKNALNGSRFFETWTAGEDAQKFIKCLLVGHDSLPPDILLKCQQYNINESVNIVNYFPAVALDISYDNLVPITQFIDTKQYYYGASPSTSLSQGLAEYTNANFFSDDTLFAAERYPIGDGHYFPFPRRESTDLQSFIDGTKPSEIVTAEDNTMDKGIWISKTADGELVGHLARSSVLTKYTYNIFGEGELFYRTLYKDEKCHEDYAKLLIPRAVGYSAGLLDYFFRGELELVLPEEAINANGERIRISMYIKNNTSGEDLEPYGTSPNESKFIVSYQYELSGDTNIYYGISDQVVLNQTIPSGATSANQFIFTFVNAIPSNAMSVKYYLVYRGKLGNELDAVIGKVYYENLGITAPDSYVYSITDGSQTPYVDIYGHAHQQFANLKAKVMITDITGHILSGNIQAKVRYKKRTDYQWDLSAAPPTEAAREANFSYSTSLIANLMPEEITALDNLELRQFIFDFTNDPIPAGITDLSLEIKIKGIMQGKTTEETIAFGTKDLMEPAHHVIWNLSDMFSLDYHLRTSYTIRTTPAYADRVDLDHDTILNPPDTGDPYIDPYTITFEIGYMSQSPPESPVNTSATVVLPEGRHIRLVVLADYPAYIRMGWYSEIYPAYDYADIPFTAVINQVNNGQWQSTPANNFRYGFDGVTATPVRQHTYSGLLSCMPMVSGVYCSYPEGEAIPTELAPYGATILFPGGGLMQQQSPAYSQSPSYSKSQAASPSSASGVMIVE